MAIARGSFAEGAADGFADADPDARCEELPEAVRQAASGSGCAPDSDGDRHQPLAVVAIYENRTRHSDQDVEQRDREPEQIAHLQVREAQVALHGLDQ
jgi:hypothetical protein